MQCSSLTSAYYNYTHHSFPEERARMGGGGRSPFRSDPLFSLPPPISRPFVHGPFDSQTEKPNFGSLTYSDIFRECRNEAELIERRPYLSHHICGPFNNTPRKKGRSLRSKIFLELSLSPPLPFTPPTLSFPLTFVDRTIETRGGGGGKGWRDREGEKGKTSRGRSGKGGMRMTAFNFGWNDGTTGGGEKKRGSSSSFALIFVFFFPPIENMSKSQVNSAS